MATILQRFRQVSPPGAAMAGVDAMNLNMTARLPSVAGLDALGSRDRGLDSSEAAARLEAYGANVLSEHRVTVTGILLRQFRNPLLLLLLGCAAVSGFTGDPTDAVIIAAIVAVSVLLSFVNEYRAESAVEALHQEIHHRARVRRDGLDQLVDTITLVPGDVVSLSVGNIVPADMRLLEVDSLECDEAVLTGESLPVAKTAEPQPDSAGVELASCVFMGTIVHEGAARGVVVATGPATAFGGIASGLAERVDSATDVAKDAADIVLLDKDLGVLADGVVEGRRVFANTIKYVLMATSSNFGKMFSAAVASVFLSFLPMLPSQILLNNLLYNAGQLAIPTDAVDSETLARPAAWDLAFVRRFMIVFGPVSSVFDFLTFFVMLDLLNANHNEFRTGWFVESLATQTLVIYVIRTRRVPFVRSRPSLAMLIVPPLCAMAGAIVPFTPVAHVLGFSPLPVEFFLILVAMIVTYLALVECVKIVFYAARPRAFVKPPTRIPCG